MSALVFTRTKHGADKVTRALLKEGIKAKAIHGDKSQNSRQQALNNFKNKETRVLVATDIAARGLDVDNLTHVINYEIPNIPETYVHRIGRTGRAGASGISLSFCNDEEKFFLKDINKLIGKLIPIIHDHPFQWVKKNENEVAEPVKINNNNNRNNPPARPKTEFRKKN